MDYLHNMSCPPKSQISYEIKKISDQVLFDPDILIKYFKTNKGFLTKRIKEYCEKNNSIYKNPKAPKGYMIGKLYTETDHDYDIEKDIELLIIILSRTYGNMYVPSYDISFNKHRFENKILFLKKELLD